MSTISELLQKRAEKLHLSNDVAKHVFTSSNVETFFLRQEELYKQVGIEPPKPVDDRIQSIDKVDGVTIIMTDTYKYEYVIDELYVEKKIYNKSAGVWRIKHHLVSDTGTMLYEMADEAICEKLGKLPRLINWKNVYAECVEGDQILLKREYQAMLHNKEVMTKLLNEDLHGRIAYAAGLILVPNSTDAGYKKASLEKRLKNQSNNGYIRKNRTQEINDAIQASTLDEVSD